MQVFVHKQNPAGRPACFYTELKSKFLRTLIKSSLGRRRNVVMLHLCIHGPVIAKIGTNLKIKLRDEGS